MGPSIHPSVCLSVRPSVHPSVCLSVCPSFLSYPSYPILPILSFLSFLSYPSYPILPFLSFLYFGSSDLCVVQVKVEAKCKGTPDAPFHRTVFRYSKADWDGFRSFISGIPIFDIFKHGSSKIASLHSAQDF